MENEKFQVIFEGQIIDGHEISAVKTQLAALFKIKPQQAEQFFTGKPVIIKKNIDKATATKYISALEKVGAKSKLQAINNTNKNESSSENQNSSQETTSKNFEARDVIHLKVPKDLSSITMGTPGDILVKQSDAIEYETPDLSNLSIDASENYLVSPKEIPEPNVDISTISMEDT